MEQLNTCVFYLYLIKCTTVIRKYIYGFGELVNYYYYIRSTAFFSRTTWVSWHQKGKSFWILLVQEMMGRHMAVEPYANHLHLVPDR